ncbi:MAG: response regulator, partial [Campylobacterota bacterium]|nr:response regulator [Campylobacterota bacterium]
KVKSTKGKGSTFIIKLKLEKAKDKIKTSTTYKHTIEDINTLNDSKILLVDDNEINKEIIIGLLENSGIDITTASDGKEAIDLYNKNNYELILMDIQMPIMDGYQATKIIREDNKTIPIIAVSANAMREDIEKTKVIGMNEHINKPIDVNKLFELLLKYIPKKTAKEDEEIKPIKIDKILELVHIDTSIGLFHMANNEKLYLKILSDFYNDYKDIDFQELDENFNITIHSLKGLSENIGAMDLHKVSKELNDTKNLNLLPILSEKLNLVLNELKKTIDV